MITIDTDIKSRIVDQIKTVYDPEIPIDIYELGLIYDIEIDDQGVVILTMTLTSPACPVAESLPMEVAEKIMMVEGVSDIDLRLVWDPPWSKDKMSEVAQFALDMF
jgi:FeS assembly SUF system protein